MKKLLILGLAILLFAGLILLACAEEEDVIEDEVIMGDFYLKVTLNKNRARIGDKIIATVTFKNLSDKDIEALIPGWMHAIMRKPINEYTVEDIIYIYINTQEIFDMDFLDIGNEGGPEILIESGALIIRQFEHTVYTNLYVHASAFFIIPAEAINGRGRQIYCNPIKITVQ